MVCPKNTKKLVCSYERTENCGKTPCTNELCRKGRKKKTNITKYVKTKYNTLFESR